MAKRKSKAGEREVDDRKVLQGVNFVEDGVHLTVTDPDELESRATAEQIDQWREAGVISGDAWHPAGGDEPPAPMAGSRMDRAMQRGEGYADALKKEEAAKAERAQRRAELAQKQKDEAAEEAETPPE